MQSQQKQVHEAEKISFLKNNSNCEDALLLPGKNTAFSNKKYYLCKNFKVFNTN